MKKFKFLITSFLILTLLSTQVYALDNITKESTESTEPTESTEAEAETEIITIDGNSIPVTYIDLGSDNVFSQIRGRAMLINKNYSTGVPLSAPGYVLSCTVKGTAQIDGANSQVVKVQSISVGSWSMSGSIQAVRYGQVSYSISNNRIYFTVTCEYQVNGKWMTATGYSSASF